MSICGWSSHWKLCGALGFSTERSLMYCEMMPALGEVSWPLPRLMSEMMLPSSAICVLPGKYLLRIRLRAPRAFCGPVEHPKRANLRPILKSHASEGHKDHGRAKKWPDRGAHTLFICKHYLSDVMLKRRNCRPLVESRPHGLRLVRPGQSPARSCSDAE